MSRSVRHTAQPLIHWSTAPNTHHPSCSFHSCFCSTSEIGRVWYSSGSSARHTPPSAAQFVAFGMPVTIADGKYGTNPHRILAVRCCKCKCGDGKWEGLTGFTCFTSPQFSTWAQNVLSHFVQATRLRSVSGMS